MDYIALLKQLAEQAGQNIDKSGAMVNQQAALAGKQMDNPNYQPSPAEQSNQQDYNKALTAAVAGSVAPINKGLGIMGKAEEATQGANDMYNAAQKAAQAGTTGVGLDANAVARAQQLQSRAMDMADRYKNQSRFANIKKVVGGQ